MRGALISLIEEGGTDTADKPPNSTSY